MEYVALLRGVNVGGITIRSADLRELFAGLGFDNVRTYLASGNVRFTSDAAERAELKAMTEQALTERFGYEAWIVLVTLDELRRARDELPFDSADTSHNSYVIFCADGVTGMHWCRSAMIFRAGKNAYCPARAWSIGTFPWSTRRDRRSARNLAAPPGNVRPRIATSAPSTRSRREPRQ